nr:GNAT family N-acetyltransferase [Marinibactrum halimedae]
MNFITELARYEKAEAKVKASVSDIEETLFAEESRVDALICEEKGEPIGFAVYFYNYSTWLGKLGLYLEDLYVSPEHRGKQAGKLLLECLAKIAVDAGCERFEWSVLDWNTPAIEFYESLGAQSKSEWIGYQLSGEALKAMADRAEGLK